MARHSRPPASRGSSPRLRGTRRHSRQCHRIDRIIPAPAGNTTTCPSTTSPRADHPRACGEHRRAKVWAKSIAGSSPRLRGTLFPATWPKGSPRIIPAPAGNTCPSTALQPCPSDHPRACGEHTTTINGQNLHGGSSPRLRGTLANGSPSAGQSRIIPAPAGNTLEVPKTHCFTSDHPRACGEHNVGHFDETRPAGSSPRLRGTHTHTSRHSGRVRIIPAPAGNTLRNPG